MCREAVQEVRSRLGLSKRQVIPARSTQRRMLRRADDRKRLTAAITELATVCGPCGYCRITDPSPAFDRGWRETRARAAVQSGRRFSRRPAVWRPRGIIRFEGLDFGDSTALLSTSASASCRPSRGGGMFDPCANEDLCRQTGWFHLETLRECGTQLGWDQRAHAGGAGRGLGRRAVGSREARRLRKERLPEGVWYPRDCT